MAATTRRSELRLGARERRAPATELDASVPALIVKVGQYPVASHALGAVRTLGRAGVRAYAVTEPGLTPAGVSRYCAGRFTWRVSAHDDMSEVAQQLCGIGRRIGTRSVIVPLDDESAVLADEYAGQLSEFYLLPPVRAGLARRLSSKEGLRGLCKQFGIPAPRSAAPSSSAELAEFIARAEFPVIAKNVGVWSSHNATGSSLGSTSSGPRLILDAAELTSLSLFDEPTPSYIVQEYIPRECAEEWSVNLYANSAGEIQMLFTGRKIRLWPPDIGVGTTAISAANPALAEVAARFCKAIGYRGVADMDWRLDHRDGQYKLLDFNPRVGSNFRMFVNEFGIDVVHALHLDVTGRAIPQGGQLSGRRLIVEHIDIPSRLAARLSRPAETPPQAAAGTPAAATVHTSTEYVWFAADDPLPFLALLTRAVSLFKIVRFGIASRRITAASRQRAARHEEMTS
jgi:D-aspartate ligase